MPKGGLLHVHLDATVNASALLRISVKHPAVHVRTAAFLSPATLADVVPEFRALPPREWTELKSISDASYNPGTWVPLQSARATFDAALGGPEGFDKWACESMTINPSEAYGTHNTTDKVCVVLGHGTSTV